MAKIKTDSKNIDQIFIDFDINYDSASELLSNLLNNISLCKSILDSLSKFYHNSNDGIHKVKVFSYLF